jgi:hypothetical protein
MLADEDIGLADEAFLVPRTSVSDANIRRVDVIDNGVPTDVEGAIHNSFTVDEEPPNC